MKVLSGITFFKNNAKSILLLFVSAAIAVFGLSGQVKEREIGLVVVDNLTGRQLYQVLVDVVNMSDTTVRYRFDSSSFRLPDINTDYQIIIKGDARMEDGNQYGQFADYLPDTVVVTSKQLHESTRVLRLPEIRLRRAYTPNVQLDEVTVTATKVLFYHKGDTLIYNASAFVTPEGSTLDALITQLPGVRIDRNGVITANGRKVENMLINGKDLMNGSGKLLLENLPAYTVKDIALYEKLGRMGEFMGRKTGDEQYVMDVRLKRDYHVGWLGNVDAGYGSQNKYLAKLFAMRFSDNLMMTFHFNANNLSDVAKASSGDDSWSPDQMAQGVKTIQTGGFRYNADALPRNWKISGTVDFENVKDRFASTTFRENYYQGMNIYDYGKDSNYARSLNVETIHYLLKRIGKRFQLQVTPNLIFKSDKRTGRQYGVSYDTPHDSVFENAGYGLWLSSSGDYITRNVKETLDKEDRFTGQLDASLSYKSELSGLENSLSISGYGRYDAGNPDRFDRYSIDFSTDSVPAASQYFKGHPNHGLEYGGGIDFTQFLSNMAPDMLIFKYNFGKVENTTTSDLYLLNHVSGFDWTGSALGMLPSSTEYLGSIDVGQSYRTQYDERFHKVTGVFWKDLKFKNSGMNIRLSGNAAFSNREMDYQGGEGARRVTRNSAITDVSSRISYFFYRKRREGEGNSWKGVIGVKYDRNPQRISMLDAVERVNTTNPLYLRVGNPDLKDAYRNTLELYLVNEIYRCKLQQNMSFIYESIDDAIAEARFYNPANGVTTSRPTNIDGNRSLTIRHELSVPLLKKQDLTLSTNTSASFVRSRDLSSVIESTDLSGNVYVAANVVNTSTIGETLKLDYTFGRHRVSAVGEVRYNDYRSRQEGFSGFSSWTARYGASGVVSLPAGFGLSTDMTVYTRRGFTDARLNTSDVVWNARLTKSIMKGNMTFAVDAYDMLRQLSNITYTVNAQARTEVVSNVVPAYVLFHVMYRFNRQPKR